jgi:hypothetical protein
MRRLALALLLVACQEEPGGEAHEAAPAPPATPQTKAGRITYDHILIAFEGSYAKAKTFRPKEDARRLAYDLLERIRSGGSFEALKEEYTDDRDPATGAALGPYVTVDHGVKRRLLHEIPRENFHPLLGFLIFHLKVGEVKMADWHAKDCPDGWHIVKRLE